MRIDETIKRRFRAPYFCLSDTAQLDARGFACALFWWLSTSYFYTWPEKIVVTPTLRRFNLLLARRVLGEPILLIYLAGIRHFGV